MTDKKIYVASTMFQTSGYLLIDFDQKIIGTMDEVLALVTRAMNDEEYFSEERALDYLYDNMDEEDEESLGIVGRDTIDFSELIDRASEGNLKAISAILSGHESAFNGIHISAVCE